MTVLSLLSFSPVQTLQLALNRLDFYMYLRTFKSSFVDASQGTGTTIFDDERHATEFRAVASMGGCSHRLPVWIPVTLDS